MSDEHKGISDTRVGAAMIVAIVGLLIPQALVVFLVMQEWKSADIATIVGLFTGVVGTLVGAFLGVQVGAAGKAKAEDIAQRALAALPADEARAVLDRR